MLLSKKKEIKLSLIDDYIKIIVAKNFFSNFFNNEITKQECFKNTSLLTLYLEKAYDLILKKLKLDNLSLLILKKELKTNNSLYLIEETQNFTNTLKTITKINYILKNIEQSLQIKLKSLKITINDKNLFFLV